MSDKQRINDEVFPQAFALLPTKMDTLPARAEMLAIGLQESRFLHRTQIGGPAHSYYQFEQGGGVVGVMTHEAVKTYTRRVCDARGVQFTSRAIYDAMVNDDVLATCCARLLLWTLPGSLPAQNEHDKGWAQYLDAWRPGMPHPETWPAFFAEAWQTVLA